MHNVSRTEYIASAIQQETDACIEWPFAKIRSGYGHIKYKGKSTTPHRVAFGMAGGVYADGQEICHSCHNRACFNPKHLYQATHKQNAKDSATAKRYAHGERWRAAHHCTS